MVPIADSQAEYFVVNPDGSGRRKIGAGPITEIHFAGPDEIAMPKEGSLTVVNIRNGAIIQRFSSYNPTHMPGIFGARWEFSPDGSRLAARMKPGLVVMGRDGTAPEQLQVDGGISIFAWRPDGGALAFVPAITQGLELKLWDVNSNEVSTLFNARPLSIQSLTWSPDGEVIAFVARPFSTSPPPDSFRLGLVNADGTEGGYPLWASGEHWLVRWSPDGRYITYTQGSALWAYEVAK